jgi:L-fucose isomerase-like protein
MKNSKAVFGVIVGNRGFFPAALAREGRQELLGVLERQGYGAVCLTPEQTGSGVVETLADAQKCADLFQSRRADIDGIVVSLPNFGDEKAVANSIRLSGLDVPVLVHAAPDEPVKMLMGGRRDSFCGKISVCNNLWQYGIRYSLTAQHTVASATAAFQADLARFAATCRVVRGLENLRVGMVGARPAAFNTVRFSEKLLERAGITVETIDLSEILGRVARLGDGDAPVKTKLEALMAYVPTHGIPEAALEKMARFGVVLDAWMDANALSGCSIQCWTSLQEHLGMIPCTLMSMLSERLLPSACETDVAGMISMLALQLASASPSAILDWNNNCGDDPDKAVLFHCSNLPKHFLESARMDFNEIIATSMGKENCCGTVAGRMKAGPITFCRVSTDDLGGQLRAYVGEGEMTPDPLSSFGGYGVARIPGLQSLLQFVCRNGYEHHVAVNLSSYGRAVAEALENYKGWKVHLHGGRGERASCE